MTTIVALSRGRGSKPLHAGRIAEPVRSPSHGGVDRNGSSRSRRATPGRRPLTGAWIETSIKARTSSADRVALSRGRGSKMTLEQGPRKFGLSPSHGGVDRNRFLRWSKHYSQVALSRGRGSKRVPTPLHLRQQLSPSHGGVDRNLVPFRCDERPAAPVALSRGRGSKPQKVVLVRGTALSPSHGGVDRNACPTPSIEK